MLIALKQARFLSGSQPSGAKGLLGFRGLGPPDDGESNGKRHGNWFHIRVERACEATGLEVSVQADKLFYKKHEKTPESVFMLTWDCGSSRRISLRDYLTQDRVPEPTSTMRKRTAAKKCASRCPILSTRLHLPNLHKQRFRSNGHIKPHMSLKC